MYSKDEKYDYIPKIYKVSFINKKIKTVMLIIYRK